jgi:hypothetical protein
VELFEITNIVENNLNVKKSYRLWWMLDEEVSFRVIKVDADAGEIKHYTLKKLSAVNSFVGHNVD